MEQKPSPNFDERGVAAIDILLLHYTGMQTGAEALTRLCDEQARVSAHYFIEEDGAITQLVEEEKRAWHAGVASWEGANDINARSIGIELVNPGHEWGYRHFPLAQMEALVSLAQDILARHAIPKPRVLAHSDVAPARKTDPGEKFDWAYLAERGIGLWVDKAFLSPRQMEALSQGMRHPNVALWRKSLSRYGYGISDSGKEQSDCFDEDLARVTEAFQRHFMPGHLHKPVDGLAVALLNALIAAKSAP